MNILWTKRQLKFFFRDVLSAADAAKRVWTAFRTALRLFHRARYVESFSLTLPSHSFSAAALTYDVHRFEESIAGRPYLIEVAPVSHDRWRAYIVRVPGVPTALMPFYGRTPIEAKQQLSAWLARAHERASAPAGSV